MYRKNINQSDKSKKTMRKGMVALLLALTLVMGFFVVPATPDSSNPTVAVVEAKAKKKDKKKPVIKFSGKTKITVEKNEVVKIPKTTAKDNKDGNVTKKISVTVKKGKTNYKSIATKIKKNKKVKFSSTGQYTVTYTVKDKAGNKATKKRYVTVIDSKKTDTSNKTTQTTTQQTTEPTTQATTQQTTESTTQATTEEYTIKKVKVGDKIYNIINDKSFESRIQKMPEESDKITMTIENDYSSLSFSRDSGLLDSYGYLKVLGELSAVDENNKDISESICLYAPTKDAGKDYYIIYIFVEDTADNFLKIPVYLFMYEFSDDVDYNDDTFAPTHDLLSKDPLIYGYLRPKKTASSYSSAKELVYTVEE